jgi:hypothetical protein
MLSRDSEVEVVYEEISDSVDTEEHIQRIATENFSSKNSRKDFGYFRRGR